MGLIYVNTPHVTREERRRLATTFGVGEQTERDVTLASIADAIDVEPDHKFTSMGESIREDLSGTLDETLLTREQEKLGQQIERLPAVRKQGIPDGDTEPEVLYRELVEPGWRVYDHLVSVDFFESVEENLPRFTPSHIESTAHELVDSEAVTDRLESVGFDDREQLALVVDVVNNNTRLARWVPTKDIPAGVEFDVEHVPPLQQRAMGGALLWINALDVHLWQKRILITDELLDDGYWDVKAMLAGIYLMTVTANEVAEKDALSDAELTAAMSAGTAVSIVNQEEICKNVFWITEDMRAAPLAR